MNENLDVEEKQQQQRQRHVSWCDRKTGSETSESTDEVRFLTPFKFPFNRPVTLEFIYLDHFNCKWK